MDRAERLLDAEEEDLRLRIDLSEGRADGLDPPWPSSAGSLPYASRSAARKAREGGAVRNAAYGSVTISVTISTHAPQGAVRRS